jgi:signal transduction histidine kinase
LPGPGDPKPSKLGEFFLNLCKQNKFWANTLTRTVIGILVCLSLVSIPIIKHNWLIYGFCMVGIILTYALLSWRDLGTYYLFKKPLLWSETLLYGIITLGSILIIKLG